MYHAILTLLAFALRVAAPLIVVPVVVLGASPGRHAYAQMSGVTPDLLSVLVTTDDIGPEWIEIEPAFLTVDGGALASFLDPTTGRALTVWLLLADATTPRAAAERSLAWSGTFGGPTVTAEEIAAPALGDGTVRQWLTVSLGDTTVDGDLLAWRRGAIVAVVQLVGSAPADALPYAELQDRKVPR
jgi:hypothetical protein